MSSWGGATTHWVFGQRLARVLNALKEVERTGSVLIWKQGFVSQHWPTVRITETSYSDVLNRIICICMHMRTCGHTYFAGFSFTAHQSSLVNLAVWRGLWKPLITVMWTAYWFLNVTLFACSCVLTHNRRRHLVHSRLNCKSTTDQFGITHKSVCYCSPSSFPYVFSFWCGVISAQPLPSFVSITAQNTVAVWLVTN